jgi:quinol monooxygenase YgiN
MTFTVAARYTVTDGNTDAVLNLLEQVRTLTLQEPGCLSYEPHRSADDDNIVFIIEKYREPADFDHHFASDHVQEIVLQQIVPMLTERLVTKGTPAL